MEQKIIFIESCASTNAAIPSDAPHGYALAAHSQTAGRGQRGSSWESEPGMNLTMSVMLRPQQIPARDQFTISMATALAVARTLDDFDIPDVKVKWPNDIYVGNRKICGILIENAISGGYVSRSVAGIGLNINQTVFRSPAPNPVSMKQLTGITYSIDQVARQLLHHLLDDPIEQIYSPYRSRLWRGSGVWPWITADGQRFDGAIGSVLPTGELQIGNRLFAFKEVWAADIIDPSRHGH